LSWGPIEGEEGGTKEGQNRKREYKNKSGLDLRGEKSSLMTRTCTKGVKVRTAKPTQTGDQSQGAGVPGLETNEFQGRSQTW